MADSPYDGLGWISGLVSIAVPVSLFVALKRLRGPKNLFQAFSIVCDGDCDEKLAEWGRAQSAAQSELIRLAHKKMIAVTLLALTLLFLCFLFTRTGAPKWTRYLLITSVGVTLAACWLQW